MKYFERIYRFIGEGDKRVDRMNYELRLVEKDYLSKKCIKIATEGLVSSWYIPMQAHMDGHVATNYKIQSSSG